MSYNGEWNGNGNGINRVPEGRTQVQWTSPVNTPNPQPMKGKGTGLLVFGVFLLFIGLILVAIPLTWEYTDMREISDDWVGSSYSGYYESYDEGDMVIISGEITDISPIYDDELNDRGLNYLYELDHVSYDGIFSSQKIGDVGDEISIPIELKSYTIDGYNYLAWKVTSNGEYHVAGGIILLVGSILIGIGVWKRHDFYKNAAYVTPVSYYPPLPQQAPPTSTQGRPVLYSPSIGQQSSLQHSQRQTVDNNIPQPQYGVQYPHQTYPVLYNNPPPQYGSQYVAQVPATVYKNIRPQPTLQPPTYSHQPNYKAPQPQPTVQSLTPSYRPNNNAPQQQHPSKHPNHGSSTVNNNSTKYKIGNSGRKQLKVKKSTQEKPQNMPEKMTVAAKDAKKAVHNCKFCGAKLVSKATFCIKCGKKQSVTAKSTGPQITASENDCRHCGTKLTPEAVFCIMCGKKRSTGATSQNQTSGRVTTHHTWSPPFSTQPGYQSIP